MWMNSALNVVCLSFAQKPELYLHCKGKWSKVICLYPVYLSVVLLHTVLRATGLTAKDANGNLSL